MVITDIDTMSAQVKLCSEVGQVTGHVKDGWLVVSALYLTGEGSGTCFYETLVPALEESTGTLIASLVWEGGENIIKLTVIDGEVKEEEIEI